MPAPLTTSIRLVCMTIALLAIVAGDVTRLEAQAKPSAEIYLGNSYRYYQLGRFEDSIDAARAALKQRRNYSEAWTNIAAASNALGLFEDGMKAAQEAVRLNPDNDLAADNLAWSGRGLMNRGLEIMAKGDSQAALGLFQRAEAALPNYYILEINLGVANGGIHNSGEAEKHFLRAIELAPTEPEPLFFYARWLSENGRLPEAVRYLHTAAGQEPAYLDAVHLLRQVEAEMGATGDLRAKAVNAPTPESYLTQSLVEFQAGRYPECIAAARKALELRPGYSEAWNNIAAASNSMAKWTDGIRAAEQAVRLNPDNQLAKNNLAVAKTELAKQKPGAAR